MQLRDGDGSEQLSQGARLEPGLCRPRCERRDPRGSGCLHQPRPHRAAYRAGACGRQGGHAGRCRTGTSTRVHQRPCSLPCAHCALHLKWAKSSIFTDFCTCGVVRPSLDPARTSRVPVQPAARALQHAGSPRQLNDTQRSAGTVPSPFPGGKRWTGGAQQRQESTHLLPDPTPAAKTAPARSPLFAGPKQKPEEEIASFLHLCQSNKRQLLLQKPPRLVREATARSSSRTNSPAASVLDGTQ